MDTNISHVMLGLQHLATYITNTMLLAAALVFPTLMWISKAPYGRYYRPGWGGVVPVRLAWLVQECPSFVVPAAILAWSLSHGTRPSTPQLIAVSTFLLHYFWRSFVYPFLARGQKGTPWPVVLLAFAFCSCNGIQQGFSCLLGDPIKLDPLFCLGAALWAAGLTINIHADLTLRQLRHDKHTGYKIPRGGTFEYVSAANYFGEIVEWCGWALACRTRASLAFACFAFANLAPRAHHHHNFYKEHFREYPPQRKAILPFVW